MRVCAIKVVLALWASPTLAIRLQAHARILIAISLPAAGAELHARKAGLATAKLKSRLLWKTRRFVVEARETGNGGNEA